MNGCLLFKMFCNFFNGDLLVFVVEMLFLCFFEMIVAFFAFSTASCTRFKKGWILFLNNVNVIWYVNNCFVLLLVMSLFSIFVMLWVFLSNIKYWYMFKKFGFRSDEYIFVSNRKMCCLNFCIDIKFVYIFME